MPAVSLPSSAPMPTCECGADMRRVLVQNGRRAGLEMWSCARFPACKGAVNIDPTPTNSIAIAASAPGEYAQHRHERELARIKLKRQALLPLFVSAALLVTGVAFVSFQAFGRW
jgi:ssDNA-binding Zn-finger/Zn-ribbon topoisomerase 1